MAKTALITGITGQDGSYLAEHLLQLGYEVHGLVRRVALEDPERRLGRISHLLDDLVLHAGTLESHGSILSVLSRTTFDECYHLAAQSYVPESFADEFSTLNVNIGGTHRILRALHDLQPRVRFYFAGSSEMFGRVREVPQRESTPFHPQSPYGVSKVTGHWLSVNYREAFGMYCVSGILFNHESPRRGRDFVSRKITSTAARIALGLADRLPLGNLDARRDWGHARDYVRGMHLMLQQDTPRDYVLGTGRQHSVREFCQLAFEEVDLDYLDYVTVDPRFLRPADVDALVADASMAKQQLGWEPTCTFEEMVREMVRSDLEEARRSSRGSGHEDTRRMPAQEPDISSSAIRSR